MSSEITIPTRLHVSMSATEISDETTKLERLLNEANRVVDSLRSEEARAKELADTRRTVDEQAAALKETAFTASLKLWVDKWTCIDEAKKSLEAVRREHKAMLKATLGVLATNDALKEQLGSKQDLWDKDCTESAKEQFDEETGELQVTPNHETLSHWAK
ncbi:hypothetical protein LTR66_010101 [Elasticomyces elasticus]|nr:hypothetical protein LTR66_010101 [Elasticomyces elasticus]